MSIRKAMRESISTHQEWEDRQRFRQSTGRFGNVYEEGGSSHATARSRINVQQFDDPTFRLRSSEPDLIRSKSMKQSKISGGRLF